LGCVSKVPKENAASTDLILNPITSALRKEAASISEGFGTQPSFTLRYHPKTGFIFILKL
jgi:hypothetical protein